MQCRFPWRWPNNKSLMRSKGPFVMWKKQKHSCSSQASRLFWMDTLASSSPLPLAYEDTSTLVEWPAHSHEQTPHANPTSAVHGGEGGRDRSGGLTQCTVSHCFGHQSVSVSVRVHICLELCGFSQMLTVCTVCGVLEGMEP